MNFIGLIFKRAVAPVDNLLDRLTSYKLILYFLYTLLGWSVIASLLGEVAFEWYFILASAAWLAVVSVGTNIALSRYLNIPKNKESDLITALILSLILSPASSAGDFAVLAAAAAIAMASKYILVINRWHVFNPAAVGAFVSGLVFNNYASWWVGTEFITPVVFVGGMLVLRKMKRFTVVIVFEAVALLVIAWQTYLNHSSGIIWSNIWFSLISTSLLFFAYVMLIEPFTSPRRLRNQLLFVALVGVMYGYSRLGLSPEEALLIGNAFAYLIEPNRRLPLTFKRKIKEAEGIESFVFSGKKNFKYRAGQYLEWTLSQHESDFRGNRRYFTIASSPTEQDLMFTIRMPEKPSSFKRSVENFKSGDTILADGLSGDFILPKSEKQKLAFMAGGVGITPFRSMIKYMVDFEQERDIHLLYAASSEKEFAFSDLFDEAKKSGLQTTYKVGLIERQTIEEAIPDFIERAFYISGPYGFVKAQEKNLLELGIPLNQIKIDYFPGYGS